MLIKKKIKSALVSIEFSVFIHNIVSYCKKYNLLKTTKMPHHGHSHNHGDGCSHESHDVDNALEMGVQYSLYQKIDMNNLECLNETTDGSGKTVFKPYEKDWIKLILFKVMLMKNYFLIYHLLDISN